MDPLNEEANYLYSKINPAREQIDLVYEVINRNDHSTAVALLTQLLEISPWSSMIRELRGQSYLKMGDKIAAVSDFRSVNRLSLDGSDGHLTIQILNLSKLLYELGHAADALKEIRECLKLDPEHKDCFPFYKKIKKIDKLLGDAQNSQENREFKECISSAEKVLKLEKEVLMIIFGANQLLCSCSVKNDQYSEALAYCKDALNIVKDPNVMCDRAEAQIGNEMYDDAIRDYHEALEMDETLQRAKEGIEKAKRLQKQSERRDYYKILGVTKSATKQEVVKAYR